MQHISSVFPSGPICVHRLGEANPDGTRLCAKNNTKFSKFYSLASKIVERRQHKVCNIFLAFFPLARSVCIDWWVKPIRMERGCVQKTILSFLIFIPW